MVYMYIALFVVFCLCLFFGRQLIRFPLRRLTLIAILAAFASVGRFALQGIPSVQPSTFIVIVCGLFMGGSAGFFCGVLLALLSSLLTSLGPWTVYQALFWGLAGLCAAPLSRQKPWVIALYGLLVGYLFGWGMNFYYIAFGEINFVTFFAACVNSFYMDTAHAVTNALLLFPFLTFAGKPMKKLLQ